MPQPSNVELACPHCSASVMPDWISCWLCGEAILSGTAKPREQLPAPTVGTPQGESDVMKLLGRGVLGLLAFIVFCMTVGIAMDEGVGASAGFLLFLLPGFGITTTKFLNRRDSATAMSAFQVAVSFVKYTIFTYLVVIGIFVALLVATIAVCLSSGPINFH